MIPVGDEEIHEGIEVQAGADHLRSEAGRGRHARAGGLP